MGKVINHGWASSSDEIPQPISVVMGRNLRKNSERPYHFSPVVEWQVTRENYLRIAYPERGAFALDSGGRRGAAPGASAQALAKCGSV
jgi:hypothetical protein